MAGSQVEIAITQIEKQRQGYQGISLTNFDNDNEPQIAAGSVVEIGGALFHFTAPESITGWGAIGNDNDVYIKLVVSGFSVTAEFTTAAPTWDTAKQGWYVGLQRYIGGLYKDAGGDYTAKYLFDPRSRPIRKENIEDAAIITAKIKDAAVETVKIKDGNVTTPKIADGNITGGKLAANAVSQVKIADDAVGHAEMKAVPGSYDTENIAGFDNWVIPAGFYLIYMASADLCYQVYLAAGWRDIVPGGTEGITVLSDGAKHRINNTGGDSKPVVWMKYTS